MNKGPELCSSQSAPGLNIRPAAHYVSIPADSETQLPKVRQELHRSELHLLAFHEMHGEVKVLITHSRSL